MNEQELKDLFNHFNNLNVLIVGDVMLDSYWWGEVSRISPEAPVPVVSVTRKESRPGGAANVALNVRAMGANAFICSVTGDDDDSLLLRETLTEAEINTEGLIESGRKTTVKTRILGNHHQLLRVDHEKSEDLDETQQKNLIRRAEEIIDQKAIGVIIFQDYDKGVITPKVIEEITLAAGKKNIPVAVDPKRKNFHAYKNCTLFKPNLKELGEGLKKDISKNDVPAISEAACEIRENLNAGIVLLTLSENGVMFCNEQGARFFPAHVRSIADVSGAGDTVISVAALCLALGVPTDEIASISNLAGGLVCEKVGVVPVNKEELFEEAVNLFTSR